MRGYTSDKWELTELQNQNLPFANNENVNLIITPKKNSGENGKKDAKMTIKVANEYFKFFVAPNKDGRCIGCDMKLGDIFGTFMWDEIISGEGRCSHCGYPARAIHFIKEKGNTILTIDNMILQYHPSILKVNKPKLDNNLNKIA